MHFGAADAKGGANEYDLVFDESMQVEFVMENTLAGDSNQSKSFELAVATESERKSPSAAVRPLNDARMMLIEEDAGSIGAGLDRTELDIQQVRQSLPTFAYRDDLLDAISRFQVQPAGRPAVVVIHLGRAGEPCSS